MALKLFFHSYYSINKQSLQQVVFLGKSTDWKHWSESISGKRKGAICFDNWIYKYLQIF